MTKLPMRKTSSHEQTENAFKSPEFFVTLTRHLIKVGQMPETDKTDEELKEYFKNES